MFQGLSQGATISVLYRNEPRVADGRVVAVSTHIPAYNPNQPMAMLNGPVTDLTVQIGSDTVPFVGLPANGVTANFPDKGMFIAIDKNAVLREVESMKTASQQIIDQLPAHQKMVTECESLLLQLQPERQKEAKQEREIEILKSQLEAMNTKFSELVGLLHANLGNKQKDK